VKRSLVFIFSTLISAISLCAQDDFYDIRKVQEIRITFRENNWKHLLDSLIFTGDGNERMLGDVTVNGEMFRNCGIRYKGFSSVDTGVLKNPFSIDLDYQVKHRNYQGYTNIKLSNVISDPSFVREVLSYEIARKYLPEPQANFTTLYVNDTLLGLYTSVEAVNKLFIRKYFITNENTFIKGAPETLIYPFGENANLACTHGPDSLGYVPYYELESTYGWTDLYHFIYSLDKQPDSLEYILNTDRTLWMHAFNFVLVNLDSYIGYSQNYYLYKDDNGLFCPVIWDLNMSFGSFRHTDGSYHFTGITIPQAKRLNPLTHLDFCVSPRPLMTKMFSNATYRKMFFAHMRTILDENFRNNLYYQRAVEIQSLIDPYVRNDPNKFYPYSDFHSNADSTVGGTGGMLQYPGIKDLMQARMAYLDSLGGFSGTPVITAVSHLPESPEKGEETWITANGAAATKMILAFRNSSTAVFSKTEMLDDGNHHDGSAGDGIYGVKVIPAGAVFQYYLYAENDSAGAFSPQRAAYEFYSFQPMIGKGDVTINEIHYGSSGLSDENKTTGSWIEICNNTPEKLSLHAVYLSDDAYNPGKWPFPDTVINARNYLVIWADDFAGSGLHTSFSLSDGGGRLQCINNKGGIIDSVTYGNMVPERTTGRYPNGYGPFVLMRPSFAAVNNMGTTPARDFLLYPNPANGRIFLETENYHEPLLMTLIDSQGRNILEQEIPAEMNDIVSVSIGIDISGISAGFYTVKLVCQGTVMLHKLIIY